MLTNRRHLLQGMLVVPMLPLAGCGRPATSRSDRLTIALQAEPNSIDPHFSAVGSNQGTSMQIFDTLLTRDAALRFVPALALSVERIDPLTWMFHLRPGVTFHDGTPFTAADVVFSIRRAASLAGAPASYAGRVAGIREATAPDPLRVQVVTRQPFPQLLYDLTTIYIVPAHLGAAAETEAFNAGTAAIGTGPYRFRGWQHGDRVELVRNESYWGDRPAFADVTMRFLPNDAARAAALLSGSVDVIDAVPPGDIDWIRKEGRFRLWQEPTVTMLYLGIDSDRDRSPFVAAADGTPLDRNPLKDPRVRRALSMAIDRQLLVDKVLSGAGVPAGQMVPAGIDGYADDIAVPPYDPAGARALLAEAGWPNGFRLTLHAPNNRYVADGLVAQAVAAMLARAGLDLQVETSPKNMFLPRATSRQFSLFLYGYGATTGTSLQSLKSVAATYAPSRGAGGNNRGRYSDPRLDEAIFAAERAEDPAQSLAHLRDAARLLAEGTGIVPLYHQVATWATRKDLAMVPRRDERTLAATIAPAANT